MVGKDLVITQLVLEVDSRFGGYGRCNICVNGSDHHGHNNCTDGEYICGCGDPHAPPHGGQPTVPCGAAVGKENLTDHYAGRACAKGRLLEVNERLIDEPGLASTDPLNEGFLCVVQPRAEDARELTRRAGAKGGGGGGGGGGEATNDDDPAAAAGDGDGDGDGGNKRKREAAAVVVALGFDD